MIQTEKSPKVLAGDWGFTKEKLIEFVTHISVRNQFTSRIRKAPIYFDDNNLPVESWVLSELKVMGYVIEREEVVITRQKRVRRRERLVLVSRLHKENLQ